MRDWARESSILWGGRGAGKPTRQRSKVISHRTSSINPQADRFWLLEWKRGRKKKKKKEKKDRKKRQKKIAEPRPAIAVGCRLGPSFGRVRESVSTTTKFCLMAHLTTSPGRGKGHMLPFCRS
ncbi:uncharacterized protein GLRG_01194 [Colletotrichum graminicola M1.001]|uniref:Uncharacterized protein n=1 Tax=Colletotrichum graminicola (strain M1.001 / M2 / FGSC 10212) TaxID=645133 RepID=E3Q4N5_COLGM|nr:uncharacterized protein GLRG_01194 [Colletotrichum graminicola M1.001]EFQ26050.1 hypothetical protein GLRG_01194 [Colletotrichum graminicola M1.001]